MAAPTEIRSTAEAFAKADFAVWTEDTSKAGDFVGASDALFFGDTKKGVKPLAVEALPQDRASVAEWIGTQPTVKAEFDKLGQVGSTQALRYVEVSIATRAAKDKLVALQGGEVVRAAIDHKIEADYGDGDKSNKFKATGFDERKYLSELVDSAVPKKLGIKGADPKVAAWQEAMNEYNNSHSGMHIDVDGAWGENTKKLYKSLGKDSKEVLNKMKSAGIVLHPEHFEVGSPDNTGSKPPASKGVAK